MILACRLGLTCLARGFDRIALVQHCVCSLDTTKLSIRTLFSVRRAAFETNFKADVALVLSVEPSRITITEVVDGSVLVTFTVVELQATDLETAFAAEVRSCVKNKEVFF